MNCSALRFLALVADDVTASLDCNDLEVGPVPILKIDVAQVFAILLEEISVIVLGMSSCICL